MGLETVELVMEVEDSFDCRIPDEAAERMLTVGDVYHHLTRPFAEQPIDCLPRFAFRKIRGLLDGKRVRPSDPWPDPGPRLREFRTVRLKTRQRTVGWVTRELLSLNYGALARVAGFWSPDSLWASLRRIISRELDVSLPNIRYETSFVADLGL